MNARSHATKVLSHPPSILLGWGSAALCMFFFAAWAGQGAEVTGNSEPNLRGLGLKLDRPVKADLLTLEDGQTLSGRLLNDTLSLQTAYGELKIETRRLAGIDLAGVPGGLAVVVTVNSNRLTGFLNDSPLRFQTEGGKIIEPRREKVVRVLFARREAELSGLSQGQWIRLRNGDLISGRLRADSLQLTTSESEGRVNLSDVGSILFTRGASGAAVLSMHDGRTLRGTLTVEELPLRLDAGPELNLYRGSIEWLSERIDGPAATEELDFKSELSNFKSKEGMIWIQPGEFIMGSPLDEAGRDRDEGPLTTVVIPLGFWMSKCEVSQAEYQQVMGANPSNNAEDPQRPVDKVSWHEAMNYCSKLTEQAQAAGTLPKGFAYRLPTEAEWEYACRAGTSTRFSCGDDRAEYGLRDYAWFTQNSDSTAHPVGTKQPNQWGLTDMHGNVWEWCLDRWENSLPGGTTTNTPVAGEGTLRAARGGSWLYEAKACRSANRDDYSPSNRCSDLGFRVVLAPIQP